MVGKRLVYWAFVGRPERKRSLGNDGRIVLKWILTFSHRDLNGYSPPSRTKFFSLGI
jgi:hypothetical protein